MSKLIIIPFAVFVAVFWLEEIFPYASQKSSRSMHGLNNIAISFIGGVANLVFLIFFIPVAGKWNASGISGALLKTGMPPGVSFVLTFLLFDLWMYLWHRANHRIPFFWLFHRAHHSDTDMDSTTALRTHPFELISASFFNVSLVSFFGTDMGHLLVYNLTYQSLVFFHHSNIALPQGVDRFLRGIVVTPAMHRLHHSVEEIERNANYSSVLSCWDRLARSFRMRTDVGPRPYGLSSFRQKRWQDLGGFLFIPFVDEKEVL